MCGELTESLSRVPCGGALRQTSELALLPATHRVHAARRLRGEGVITSTHVLHRNRNPEPCWTEGDDRSWVRLAQQM